jgi:hypothetical protein
VTNHGAGNRTFALGKAMQSAKVLFYGLRFNMAVDQVALLEYYTIPDPREMQGTLQIKTSRRPGVIPAKAGIHIHEPYGFPYQVGE